MTDAERSAYNDALSRGDADEATRLGLLALAAIHRRIMDEDERYHAAGWKPGQ